MNRRERLLLKAALLERYATIIENDDDTDGFWNLVAEELLGEDSDHGDLSDRQTAAARKLKDEIATSLRLKSLHSTVRAEGS